MKHSQFRIRVSGGKYYVERLFKEMVNKGFFKIEHEDVWHTVDINGNKLIARTVFDGNSAVFDYQAEAEKLIDKLCTPVEYIYPVGKSTKLKDCNFKYCPEPPLRDTNTYIDNGEKKESCQKECSKIYVPCLNAKYCSVCEEFKPINSNQDV